MKDVSLDDLIKEDKAKNKSARPKKPNHPTKKGAPSKIIKGRRIIRGSPNSAKPKIIRPNREFNSRRGNKDLKRRPNDFQGPNRGRNKVRNEKVQRNDNKQAEKPKPKQQKPANQKGRTLKVLGLHPDITNADLYKLFSGEGALEKCMIEQDNFGRNLPQAIVKYHSSEHAKSAQIKFNDHKVMNSVLTVQPYKNKK